MKKKKKVLKLWNGRGIKQKEHLFIGAYSVADACQMLVELYPWQNENRWRYEITKYFNTNCWGNTMDGIIPERGVWVQKNQYSTEETLERIYPIVKKENIDG